MRIPHKYNPNWVRQALWPAVIAALLFVSLPLRAVAAEPTTADSEGNHGLYLPIVAQDRTVLCRFGVNKDIDTVNIGPLRAGWYITYGAQTRATAAPPGVEFFPTIRLTQPDPATNDWEYSIWANHGVTTEEQLIDAVQSNFGAEWFISNEPDRIRKQSGQDGVEPQVYAIAYQYLYHFIKDIDPSATIIAGSIVQPTEIRLDYLDMVLSEYLQRFGEPMPVDAWATHNFILNEVRDGWGADIPPGMEAESGLVIVDVDDIIRMDLFTQQIERMRRWMADNGYRDAPLYVSEYGVLHPETRDGVPWFLQFTPAVVNNFMNQTFDYMLSAVDPLIGFPADEDRLVQRFSWYSVYDKNFNGSLYSDSGALTEIGANYADYTAQFNTETDFRPISFNAKQDSKAIVLSARIGNSGNVATEHFANVRFYNGNPIAGGFQVGPTTSVHLAGCGDNMVVESRWEDAGPGPFTNLYVRVEPIRLSRESNTTNNQIGPIATASSP